MASASSPRTRPAPGDASGVDGAVAAGFALAGSLFTGLVLLLGARLEVALVGLLGSGLLAAGAYRDTPALTWAGLVGLGLAGLGVRLAAPVGVDVLVFALVGTALFGLALTALGEADAQPLVRAKPATRGHLWRWLGLCLLWGTLVVVPLAFAPVRLALASEMGTTLAVLLVAGASVLVFALPLAGLRGEREAREVEVLREREVRFGVRAVRRPGDE